MKNLLMKCIEAFLIYIILIFKKFKLRDYYRFLFLKVHFTLKKFNLLHGFSYQSHV
jgi:hypothetical protein